MGGRGGSSGSSKYNPNEIAKGLSRSENQISANDIERIRNKFILSHNDRRVQIAGILKPSIGKTFVNNASVIGSEIGITNMKHTGNFQFEGTVAGQKVILQTKPVKSSYSKSLSQYNSIRVTDVSVPL